MSILRKLRQRFCEHSWLIDRFQALTPGTGFACTRCGKRDVFYEPPHSRAEDTP